MKNKKKSSSVSPDKTDPSVMSWPANVEHLLEAATGVGIVSTDSLGNVIYYNPGAVKMFGYTEAEILNKPYPIYAHEKEEINAYLAQLKDEYGGKGIEPWIRKIDHLGVDRKELTYVRKDGSRMVGALTLTLIKNQEGVITGLLGIVIDITRQKQVEKELQKLNQNLEKKVRDRTETLSELIHETRNFAYIVSHDLRVPLVNIRGFSSELRRSILDLKQVVETEKGNFSEGAQKQLDLILNQDMEEAFGFIDNSASKMGQMINSILKLSRMGRRELEVVKIDTQKLVTDILKQFAHSLDTEKIEIKVKNLPDVSADSFSLEQIFTNLVQNALLYKKPDMPGKVEIWGEKKAFETKFFIKDNGIGIHEKDLKCIFDLFMRSGRSTVEGEGLGLAFVRALVQKHGGRVWCESTLGEGSIFGFSISDTLPSDWLNERP